jgi:hypothetical protein
MLQPRNGKSLGGVWHYREAINLEELKHGPVSFSDER